MESGGVIRADDQGSEVAGDLGRTGDQGCQ